MIGLGRTLACALVASWVGVAAAQTSTRPAEPAPTAEQLVRDLGSPTYSVRERASRSLWKLGEKARPALLAAVRSDDVEVVNRAQEILDKFEWGIFPDTPPSVLKLIRDFRSGLLPTQQSVVTAMIKLGDPAIPTLRVLLTRATSPQNRAPLFDHLCWTLRREVPLMLHAGQEDRAEALLALNTYGPGGPGMIDYAVFMQMRGRLPQAIAEQETLRKQEGSTGSNARRTLVFLYRMGGDPGKSRQIAKDLIGEPAADPDEAGAADPRNVYDSLLEDMGAWTELAERNEMRANSRDGLAAYRLRMAGKTQQADEILDKQFDSDFGPRPRSTGIDEATLALMLNDRPLDGIERLKNRRTAPHILADLMTSRLELKPALDLLSGPPRLEDNGLQVSYLKQLYGTRKGHLLARLGQREAAAQVFGEVAEGIGMRDDYALTQLVRAEVRSGRHDLACEHMGAALARAEDVGGRGVPGTNRQDAFEVLFDADADTAQFWWRVFSASRAAGETGGAKMTRIRNLLIGKATAEDLQLAARVSTKDTSLPGTPEAEQRAVALATVYRANGKPDAAITVLSELADQILRVSEPAEPAEEEVQARRFGRGSRSWVFGIDERFRFWLELGDVLHDQGRFKEAATRYEQGWRKYPDNPLLLYLSGRSMIRAGDEKEGRRRMNLAHWVGLGNARMRGRFLEELITRGHSADVRRERDLIRDTGWVSELFVGNVWNQVARASVLLKEFDVAATANHRAIHYLLRTPGVTYVEGYAYLTVPQAVKIYNARMLLHAGKIDAAVAEAKQCLAVMPGNTELVLGMVPELDRRGRTKEANELFQTVWGTYGKLIAENPQSGWARNAAAWLAAGCRRELPTAATYAEQAVAFDPGVRSHKETLAEVCFRRGEREKAVVLMKELVAADRRNYSYKRQLERYQTAAFDSPLPDMDDD